MNAWVFDLEGTIVDVEKAHHQGHIAVAKKLGIDISIEHAQTEIPGFVGGGAQIIAAYFENESDHRFSQSEILKMMKAEYHKRLADCIIKPRMGFEEAARQLMKRSQKVAIGSLTERKEGEYLIRKAGIRSILGDCPIVFKEDVIKLKPAPDVYLETAKMLNIEPKDQVVFEDSPPGVKAAITAGCRVIAIPAIKSDHLVNQLYESGAEAVVQDWTEVNLSMFD